jgi:hypothetical protein
MLIKQVKTGSLQSSFLIFLITTQIIGSTLFMYISVQPERVEEERSERGGREKLDSAISEKLL